MLCQRDALSRLCLMISTRRLLFALYAGSIPSGIGRLVALRILTVANNKLTAKFEQCFSFLRTMFSYILKS